jgi:hypothetical protein
MGNSVRQSMCLDAHVDPLEIQERNRLKLMLVRSLDASGVCCVKLVKETEIPRNPETPKPCRNLNQNY